MTPQRGAGRRGFVLLVVLWFLVLLAAIGTYLLANARSQTALAHNVVASAKAEALADAGIAQAAFNLTDPLEDRRWRLDGAPHSFQLLGGEVTVRLGDETQKINPNFASASLLAALFESLGTDRSAARRLGVAIADWVDKDDAPRPGGAEAKQYADAGLPYRPPNALIESLDDLRLVQGMTPEIFAAARPFLTIFTDVAAPEPKGAPLQVQRALALEPQIRRESGPAAEGGAAAANGDDSDQDSDSNGENSGQPPAQSPSNSATPKPAAPKSADSGAAIVADVEVTARAGGSVFVRYAVLRFGSDKPAGYDVLEWRRGTAEQAASAP
jgi:general secretion pathway protein K